MSIAGALLVIAACDGLVIVLMLLLRARAPEGGYFKDTQQAAGTFAVVGTSFAVLLAFVFLLAFQSFDAARDDAEKESDATLSLFHVSEEFGPSARDALQGELVCYARGVVSLEWPAMRHGRESPVVASRVESIEHTFEKTNPKGQQADAALSAWFDRSDDRQSARRGRLSEAQPFVPSLVWVILILSGAICIAFVCSFADKQERHYSQAIMAFAVATIVVSGLVLVKFLDEPYADRGGSVRPSAMERALHTMDASRRRTTPAPVPCDGRGRDRI